MADIDLHYDLITNMSTLLTGAHDTIGQSITDLRTRVDNLVQRDGGLWLNSTSPAIQTAYDNFSQSALQVVTSIASFSDMFKQLVMGMASMDEKMAYQIQNPPPATGGAPQKALPALDSNAKY